jgi:hypothetical protein
MDNRIDNTTESRRRRNVEAAMKSLRNSESADEQRYFLGVLRKLNLTPDEEEMVKDILSKKRKLKP